MKYELITFDWDGTLVDSIGHIVGSMQCSMRDMDIDVLPDEKIKSIIGLGMQEALDALFPLKHDDAEFSRHFRDRYRYHYMEKDVSVPDFFHDVAQILEDLKQNKTLLAVATGKSRRGLAHALDSMSMNDFFHSTRCADEAKSKPHPQMVSEILVECGVGADKSLMVGDSVHDLSMANQAGIDAVALTHGAQSKASFEAYETVGVFDSMTEFYEWFYDINKRIG